MGNAFFSIRGKDNFNADLRKSNADKRGLSIGCICDHLRVICGHLRSRRIIVISQQRGQGMVETAVIFILIFLLLGGIIRIWLWSNNQIVQRQLRYNAGRIEAGTAEDDYTLQWPLEPPQPLTEDEVIY